MLYLFALFVVGCNNSYNYRCPVGVYPFDGQTAVPLDQEIVFDVSLKEDQPYSYDDLLVWETESGTVVDGDVRFEFDQYNTQIVFTPKQPLKADTVYQARGVELTATRHYPNMNYVRNFEQSVVEVSFSTSSAPKLLGMYYNPSSYGDPPFVISLIFSEPIHEEDAANLTIYNENYGDALTFEFQERNANKPHIVQYTTNYIPSYQDDSYSYGFTVSGERLRSADGSIDQGPFIEWTEFDLHSSIFSYIKGNSCSPYFYYY